jgi:hypothetical protein
MLVGLGGLGSVVLEMLLREPALGEVVVASRNAEKGLARCNLARLGALAQGISPSVRFTPLDLHNQEAVAETVHAEAPDLILSTATMLTWWLPRLLPPAQAAAIRRAGFGVWLPVHLTLTLKLMQALRAADYRGITLTAPFPDVVNAVLARLDLAPTCGVGNVGQFAPKVQHLAAERLGVPFDSVRVFLVAHHALGPAAYGLPVDELPPYFLRIEHAGQDVTAAVGADELLLAPYPRTFGPAVHFLTAGATLGLIRALFSAGETPLHAPAPGGLPGGYPVVAGRGRVRPARVSGLTLDQAIAINEDSHRFDGIARIEPDGAVVFCPQAAGALRDELGYDCTRLAPHESEQRAGELIARFRAYAERHGVHV